jgi:hypothetical protein
MKRKAARFYFLAVFAFTVVFTVISPNESKAKTEIFTNGATCTITILLRKQFYTHTPVSLNQWIADLNNKIAEAQEILDRGWLGRLLWGAPTPADRNQAQDDINYYNGQINDIQSVIANCAALNAP